MMARWLEALTFLVNNAALLVALGVLYTLLQAYTGRRWKTRATLTGIALGVIAIAVMQTAWEFAPGIIFDTRSIVLSLAGLFFGWRPAAVAGLVAATFRLALGGPGAITGAIVALTSVAIGLLWRRLVPKQARERSPLELYLFGIVVHLNMLLWMFSLPWPTAVAVLQAITASVLLLYPVATMFFGWLIVRVEERWRVYEALAKSEARYRQLVERVPAGLYRSTPEGQLLEANPAMAEMLGYPDVDSLLAVNAQDLYHDPKDRERWQQEIAAKGVVRQYEQRLRRADGSVIWVRDTARVIRDASGRIRFYEGALEDITALKEAEEARQRLLVEAQRRAAYLATLNRIMSQAGTAETEAQFLDRVAAQLGKTVQADWVAIWAGSHVAFWQTPEEVARALAGAAERLAKALPPPRMIRWTQPPADRVWQELAPVMHSHGVTHMLLVPFKSERLTWGLISVACMEMCGWDEDTLTLVEAVAQHVGTALDRLSMLREARERAGLATLSASLTLNLSRPNKVEEVTQAIGEAALRLSRADRAAVYVREGETVHCAWRHRLSDGYVSNLLANLDQVPGGNLLRRTHIIFIPDVRQLPPEARLRELAEREGFRALAVWPLIYEGQTIAAVACYHDQPHAWTLVEKEIMAIFSQQAAISLRNAQLLEELARTNTALREALQVREDILRNVTHELRTPLTLIRGYAELLLEGLLTDPQELQTGAQSIYRNACHLEHLIDQLLAFQRLRRESHRRDTIDVARWLREVAASWEASLKKVGLQLRLDLAPDLGVVQGHQGFLNQVVYNLLDNARKFSPEGGTILLKAWVHEDEVHVQVADEGIGIPPDKLDKIFDRFYQVDPSTTRRFGGMGLGLALVKEIVEAHGGRVWAESEGEGKGTRITFTLPRKG